MTCYRVEVITLQSFGRLLRSGGRGGEGFRDDRKFCGDGKSGNFVIFGFLILGEPIGEHVDFLQFSSVVHVPIFSYCS